MTTLNNIVEDVTKTRRQKEALTRWKDNNYRGTLNLTMRFGKTMCAYKAIAHVQRLSHTNPTNILYLAPNTVTKRNAKKVCSDLNNVSYATYQELCNVLNMHDRDVSKDEYISQYSLIIIDEVQKAIGINTNIYDILNKYIVKCPKILALSGSTFVTKQIDILNALNIPICDKISEIEAISNGWVSKYEEYNLAIPLDKHLQDAYHKSTEYIAATLDIFKSSAARLSREFKIPNLFKSDFDVIYSCFIGKTINKRFVKPTVIRSILATIMGWNRDLDLTIEYNAQRDTYWNPDAIYERAKTFKQVVKSRNDLLITNRAKLNAVIDIISMNSVPTICFNESTEMADLECDYFSEDGIAYHSNIESKSVINPDTGVPFTMKNGNVKIFGKKGLLNLAIDGVRNGTYRYIFTAKALNEGITIENIRQVIITAGDVNPQTYEQRTARGKTIDASDLNKNCIVINLYIDDFFIDDKLILSRDKQKLMQRQLNATNVQWVNSIDDIFTS